MTPLLELNRPGQRSMHAHSHAGWAVWEGRPLLMVEAHYCQLVTQRIMFKASPSQAVRLAAVQLALMNPYLDQRLHHRAICNGVVPYKAVLQPRCPGGALTSPLLFAAFTS